jgi:uncharacterized membrane protein
MPLPYAALLCLHALAAAFWVGGMAVITLAVRPAAAQTLEPPLRLAFMAAALKRFFDGVLWAIVLLLTSGAALIALAGGFGRVHWSVHAMLALGVVMVLIFAQLRWGPAAQLQRAVAGRDWAAAAANLALIRPRVMVNLGLGVLVFMIAIAARGL